MIQTVLAMHNGKIRSIVISGHSGSADKGEDLICAAVSSIGTGTLNALDELVPDTCELELNEIIEIRVIQDSRDVQLILNTMLIQLKTIAEEYPKNLEIDRKE